MRIWNRLSGSGQAEMPLRRPLFYKDFRSKYRRLRATESPDSER